MNFVQTALPGVVLIEPKVFEDDRGWFMESFNERRFADGLFSWASPFPSRLYKTISRAQRKARCAACITSLSLLHKASW